MLYHKYQSTSSNLDDLFSYFQKLNPREIDLDLVRILSVLDMLNAPHLHLPPTIHVAGTNGKGSTISYLRGIYEAAGMRVHVYTSPHLIHYNERIRLAGTLITDEQLIHYLNRVQQASRNAELTFFEAFTAAAFLAFSENQADILLLETGLGGRLDATNVIENPLACVLTPVSLDHQDFLGETVHEIAREKAGIIKYKTPIFMARQISEAHQVFIEKATQTGSKIFSSQESWDISEINENGFQFIFEDKGYELPLPQLAGKHQVQNAALAVAVTLGLKDKLFVSKADIKQGLIAAEWAGRLQPVTKGKLYVPGVEMWIDGAHNAHGFQVLSEFIEEKQSQQSKEMVLVVAMLNNRDPKLFFQFFEKMVDRFIFVQMPEKERFHPPETLANYTQKPMQIANVEELTKIFQQKLLFGTRIFITGSLYLVGKALDINNSVIV